MTSERHSEYFCWSGTIIGNERKEQVHTKVFSLSLSLSLSFPFLTPIRQKAFPCSSSIAAAHDPLRGGGGKCPPDENALLVHL